MSVQVTKSYSFFIAHILENQRLHLLCLGILNIILFLLYQWQWPSQALGLAFLALVIIVPFSFVYRCIKRSSWSVEQCYQKLTRVAFWQSWLNIVLITVVMHATGGYSSPVALLYILLLGGISVFYPAWQLVILNLWALALYTGVMQAYIHGWISPGFLPSLPHSLLGIGLAPLIWIIYVVAILLNWLMITTHSRRVRSAWSSSDEQNQYLDDLHGLTRLGLEHEDLGALYATMAAEIRKILGADNIYITRWDAENELVYPGAASGEVGAAYLSMPPVSRRETSMTASVYRAEKALIARDVFCTPYISLRLALHFPNKSMLGIPLYGLPDHRFLGALLVSYKSTHDFSAEEVEHASQLADVAALLISRTRLYHETQHRARLLEQFTNQITALTSNLRRTTLLPAIVEAARELLHTQRAALHLYNQDTRKMNCEYSVGLSTEYLEYMVNNFESSPEAETLHNQNFVLIPDVFRDERTITLRNMIAREQFRAYAVFALHSAQGNLGTLSLYWDQPRAISSTEVSVGQLFAQRAGAMLHSANLYEQANAESLTDVLTNLPNRRYFDRRLAEECERSRRYGHPFSLLLLDLDGFKTINDAFGHAIGDSVICQIASALLRLIRASDMVARFGGDEFSVIVPEADLEAALHLAGKIKMLLAATKLHLPNNTQRYISACIGIAVSSPECADAKALFNLADQRMYRAKRTAPGSVIFGEN